MQQSSEVRIYILAACGYKIKGKSYLGVGPIVRVMGKAKGSPRIPKLMFFHIVQMREGQTHV